MKRVLSVLLVVVMAMTVMAGCGEKESVNENKEPVAVTLDGRYVFSINGTASLVMEYSGENVKFLNENPTQADLNSIIFEGTYTCIDGVITVKYLSNGETYAVYDYNEKDDTVIASASGMVFAKEAKAE